MTAQSSYLDTFRINGRLLATIRQHLVDYAQTHYRLEAIEAKANELIRQVGGEPAFKRVPGYHWATCINVNDQIVHAIPKGKLAPGDLVTVDIGMFYHGTTTDCATSFTIGPPSTQQRHFLAVGRQALDHAITQARVNHCVRDISQAIQQTVEAAGFNVVRTLSGHGLGKTMHEDPQIPCYVSSDPVMNTPLKVGMVLAIEVMYMVGNWPLKQAPDGWTLSTADGSLAAVFEDDVIITSKGPEIITTPV